MANFNRVIMLGNLTRDPQLRYLPSQMAVVDFGLAVNHRFKTKSGEDREEVCFIDCSAFGRQAEIINQYCRKGRPLLVEGRLKFDTWEDKQGGGKRSKHTVVIDNFQLLGGGQGAGGGPGSGADHSAGDDQRPPARGGQRSGGQQPQPPFGEEQTFQEDDIPF